jgi:rod shape-determining protein MreC
MYNLLKFILKYHFTFLFVLLQLLNLFLIFQNNRFQQSIFLNSANAVTGSVYAWYSGIKNYIGLREENERLIEENAILRSNVEKIYFSEIPAIAHDTLVFTDTLFIDTINRYEYFPATVVSNSTNRLHNTVFIDKGSRKGIAKGMGVVGTEGIVGVVKQTSPNYSLVIPVINRDVNISAKIKNTGYFGNLSWDGKNPYFAQLTDIPSHIFPQKGDTVVTSGFSHIFPEGEMIGYVDAYKEVPGTGFLAISVKLSTNFNTLKYVYVVKNKDIEEIKDLCGE